jgi:ankyrin repeat protein
MSKHGNVDAVLDAVWEAAVEFSGSERPEVNSVGMFGNTPISVAITWGDLEAVKLLVEAGANIDVQMERGSTPLHEAISAGEFDIARYLVRMGADQTIKNDEGKLPRDMCWEGEWDGIFGVKNA